MSKGAVISSCGLYRYSLTRVWQPNRFRVLWIMLNPSTADASNDDPTIRKIMKFSKRWLAGSIEVVNLYGFRATNPKDLLKAADPVGPSNDAAITRAARVAGQIVVAWGNNAKPDRVEVVRKLLANRKLLCLHKTKQGAPGHPLYLPDDRECMHWSPDV